MSEQVSLELGGSEHIPLKLMLIDSDPIYRAGLRVVLEFAQLQVVAEAENSTDALHTLSELSSNTTNIQRLAVDLVLLDLHLDLSLPSRLSGLRLCQQLKSQYPHLPVLLLSSTSEPTQLVAAQQAGADGYCHKGISPSKLVAAIQQVAAGRSHWEYKKAGGAGGENPKFKISTSLMRFSNRLRRKGLQQIDTSLAEVTAQLQVPGLTVLERAVLAGQRRELLASRWVVNHLLATPEDASQQSAVSSQQSAVRSQNLSLSLRSP
ncbi:MAG TPA: DUF3685 domain-containing protein, partial [Cyanobacteria bacterium UBA11049]|nr:DUF3685 domain-containing protein [Cyanobacteria bacterium UBA11049]